MFSRFVCCGIHPSIFLRGDELQDYMVSHDVVFVLVLLRICLHGEKMKIIRVFPRKTAATPDDENVRIACPPGLFDAADEVHIVVLFSWDLQAAEQLAFQWARVAPVKIGGPALGDPGGDFTPGMYVKRGYVMTSRGCPNKCWFCRVWRTEGNIRELPITEGHNLLDSNILACSDDHIRSVFAMLAAGRKKYKKPIEFTGGLEAARLKQWHVDELAKLKPGQMFFAYDTPDDLEPLMCAGNMFLSSGWTRGTHSLRCYVLCGYGGDTFDSAEHRMRQAITAGFMPMAMLYRDEKGDRDQQWMKWQRTWARPAIINAKMRDAA
jgi:hypothetical protein